MSKEYTQALDDLFGLVTFQKSLTKEQFRRAQKHFEILESALQRLEAIDNANPSEALKCLEEIKSYFDWGFMKEAKKAFTPNLETIKQALQRLESIDNANPSEALECLEKLSKSMPQYDSWIKYIDTIKEALLKAEQDKKKTRCWDIVVKKNVDMLLIKKYDNVSDYNSAVWLSGRDKLTEEEFNLLKEGIKEC